MNKLLVIVGPTGTGKTALALKLAKKFNGEIVSADSRQLYKEMDIATGKEVNELQKSKVKKGEGYWDVEGVRVHLYDLLDPKETFSVAQYQQLAVQKIKEIQAENKLPILVGGTGLYIQAVIDGLNIPKSPPNLQLRARLGNTANEDLYEELKKVDPETASEIDQNNPRRLLRALEVYYTTGEKISTLKTKYKPDYDLLLVGLTAMREELYKKADQGVETWLKLGLVAETKKLIAKGYDPKLPSMTSIGYRQITMHLEKKLSLELAVQRIKFDLHSYIRRQLTWFKLDGRINWFNITDPTKSKEVGKLVSEWYN